MASAFDGTADNGRGDRPAGATRGGFEDQLEGLEREAGVRQQL
jgi:hypothetical protein